MNKISILFDFVKEKIKKKKRKKKKIIINHVGSISMESDAPKASLGFGLFNCGVC